MSNFGLHNLPQMKPLLVKPKDQDTKDKKSGAIYSYQCGKIAYDEEDIGETGRALEERYREHLKEPSPIHVHRLQTGHNATPDNFNIIGPSQDHKVILFTSG